MSSRVLIDRRRTALILSSLLIVLVTIVAGGRPATADQGESLDRSYQAGTLAASNFHSCALYDKGSVRCWGFGANGQLGYGNSNAIGDTETPGSVAKVDLGAGRTAVAVTTGGVHTCALLDNGTVRCWGANTNGELGYGNTTTIGENETPGSVGPVDLGAGRTAVSITAGGNHTCALLDNGTVRCWGLAANGQLGYGNTTKIGDTESPGSVGPVDLGAGRTAVAVTAGNLHTCAVLDNGELLCWGVSGSGQLGYGNSDSIGDTESPGSVGPVDIGAGRSAVAVSAGTFHTCALLDNGAVRCWGFGSDGRLGYGNPTSIGDTETPGSVGTVDLGAGRTAVAVTAGGFHTCALLDNGDARCWGEGQSGQLGYGNTTDIGDTETPGSVGKVDLGAGRNAVAITAGNIHTCALLDTGEARCWGEGDNGRLGYGNTTDIGETETAGSVGTISLGGTLTASVADLGLSASSSLNRVDVGDSFSVRFDVQNSGPDTASGVTVQIDLPVIIGGSFPSKGNFNPGTGVWSAGSLASGQSASLRVEVTATSAGSLLFESEAFSEIFDPVAVNDSSQFEVTAGSIVGPTGPTGPTSVGPTGPTGKGVTGPGGPVGPSRLAVALTGKKFTGKAKKKLLLSYAATESAAVTVSVLKGTKKVAKASGKARGGANSIKVKLPKKPGKYTLELAAKAGADTAKAKAKLTVK